MWKCFVGFAPYSTAKVIGMHLLNFEPSFYFKFKLLCRIDVI